MMSRRVHMPRKRTSREQLKDILLDSTRCFDQLILLTRTTMKSNSWYERCVGFVMRWRCRVKEHGPEELRVGRSRLLMWLAGVCRSAA